MSDGGTRARLFRLWVQRGSPFTVQPKHNPVVEHDGGTTAVHLVMTDEDAADLRVLLEGYGGEVDLAYTARQTTEQKEERLALLGVGREDNVWPSTACQECAWFDPLLTEPCGRAGWPPEVIDTLSQSPKPQQDLNACPVPYVWSHHG